MNRRGFLKAAGVGATSLAAVPVLVTPAAASGESVGFRFVSNSRTATVAGVRYLAQFSGEGKIMPSAVGVEGGGTFNQVIDTSPVPKTIVASGTWKAKRLMSFNLVGTYGAIAAGMVAIEIQLVPTGGAVVPANLEVVCNIGAAGLFTGEEEGFTLIIPGTQFVPGGTFGPFIPFIPVPGGPTMGLSVFNLLN